MSSNDSLNERATFNPVVTTCFTIPFPRLLIDASKEVFFDDTYQTSLPCAIKQIHIENYQGIIKTRLTAIPVDAQWIFLTGENSFGKTSVLQAIAIGLFGKQDKKRILTEEACQIAIELKNNGVNQITQLGKPQFTHFVAYGPSRLEIQNQHAQNKMSEIVKATLLKLMPSLADIQIKNNSEVVYIERESENSDNVYEPITFEKLASGYRSLIAMIGDMLIRFYEQQPQVIEPKGLSGIVLIDELDLHFHPKWQRKLPILLSEIFPQVQFIVSTHSLIPFLGAPKNSVFLKVNRNQAAGIQLERINIEIKNLLPNSLLTSPIFDLDGEDLKQENNENISEVRTEETYDEVQLNDEIKARLAAFEASDRDFPDDLFETDAK